MEDVSIAINSWENGKYFEFGDQIGDIFMQAISTTDYGEIKFEVKDVALVVAGLMDGTIKTVDAKDIKVCLNDSSSVKSDITKAVAVFQKGGITGIKKGLLLFAKAVKSLPVDLKDCKSLSVDVAKLKTWASIFADLDILAEKMFMNILANH